MENINAQKQKFIFTSRGIGNNQPYSLGVVSIDVWQSHNESQSYANI